MVQEGGETCHRGLLGDRSETKAESAEADRGRGGCFLGFWLGWPKRRSERVWCPRGSERLRGEMAQGSAGLWADRLLSGSPFCLPDNPVVPGQKSTDYYHPPGGPSPAQRKIPARALAQGVTVRGSVGVEGGMSRPSEPSFLFLGDTPAVTQRHVASDAPIPPPARRHPGFSTAWLPRRPRVAQDRGDLSVGDGRVSDVWGGGGRASLSPGGCPPGTRRRA